ncbi:MAG: hypothetical protein WC302_00835 [Candidatus Paceibacterota bacterium]|jgi:hypothetical protein
MKDDIAAEQETVTENLKGKMRISRLVRFGCWLKQEWQDLHISFHKWSFRMLVMFLCGIAAGLYISMKIWDWRMDQAVRLKGVVISQVVYDLKERP